MATWDFGGGCACGLYKTCECAHNKQSDGTAARPEEVKDTRPEPICPMCGAAADERWDCCEVYELTSKKEEKPDDDIRWAKVQYLYDDED